MLPLITDSSMVARSEIRCSNSSVFLPILSSSTPLANFFAASTNMLADSKLLILSLSMANTSSGGVLNINPIIPLSGIIKKWLL